MPNTPNPWVRVIQEHPGNDHYYPLGSAVRFHATSDHPAAVGSPQFVVVHDYYPNSGRDVGLVGDVVNTHVTDLEYDPSGSLGRFYDGVQEELEGLADSRTKEWTSGWLQGLSDLLLIQEHLTTGGPLPEHWRVLDAYAALSGAHPGPYDEQVRLAGVLRSFFEELDEQDAQIAEEDAALD